PPTLSCSLSLHDALPIFRPVKSASTRTPSACCVNRTVPWTLLPCVGARSALAFVTLPDVPPLFTALHEPRATIESTAAAAIHTPDRKSTRLNSSHVAISY